MKTLIKIMPWLVQASCIILFASCLYFQFTEPVPAAHKANNVLLWEIVAVIIIACIWGFTPLTMQEKRAAVLMKRK
jgi:hypothetical protein